MLYTYVKTVLELAETFVAYVLYLKAIKPCLSISAWEFIFQMALLHVAAFGVKCSIRTAVEQFFSLPDDAEDTTGVASRLCFP